MAEEPSNSNPFLGSEKPIVPEQPAKVTSENASAPVSVTSKKASDPVDDADSEAIPTPSSKWRHRIVWRLATALALVLLIGGGIYLWLRSVPTTEAPVAEVSEREVATEAAPPALAPDTGTLALPDDNANYESENFKAGEIVIGGELQFLVDEDEVGALTVENIRGEAFTEKNKQEVKLVVTWTTNKLAQASVRYSKGIGQTERGVDETDYSYNHSVIISGLDPASTYLYTIDAVDRYGNRAKSDPHAVFTGARTVSLFDLIAGAIGEVFGWAVSSR